MPFTLTDFPGRIAAVVFCQGCPWRCRYCHNPHLQPFDYAETRTWEDILRELEERRGFLEAVVFSGGEPTAQTSLGAAIASVRAMGYLTGLHTAGIFPQRLAAILPLLDWVGFDLKAPLDARYDVICGVRRASISVGESLRLAAASGVALEVRTTVHPKLLTPGDLQAIRLAARRNGVGEVIFRDFRPEGCLDPELLG